MIEQVPPARWWVRRVQVGSRFRVVPGARIHLCVAHSAARELYGEGVAAGTLSTTTSHGRANISSALFAAASCDPNNDLTHRRATIRDEVSH